MNMTIKENMTIRAKKNLKDLINKKTHSPGCPCIVCLYFAYKEKKIKRTKKPFGMMSFYISWLIHEAKLDYLIEKGKAEEIIRYGRKAWQYRPHDYEKAPYLKRASKIITDLYADENLIDFAPDFEKLLNDAYLNVRHWRIERSNFSKIMNELANERWLEWVKTQPDLQKEWKINWEDIIFAPKVADFIHSQPKRQISQWTLLRHFSNKRKEDFERLHDHLKINYGINFRKEGYRNKTTVYYSTTKSSKGRYWRVGI